MTPMTLGELLLLIAGFVAVNALFVAAEFALVGAPRPAIEQRARTGDPLARRLLRLLQSAPRQDRYIATAQLGVTLASLGLGMFGEHELARWLEPHLQAIGFGRPAVVHSVAAAGAILGLTLVEIVLGEMVPKSIALQRTERVARLLYWPMRVAFIVTFPFVTVLHAIARGCLAALGIRRRENAAEQMYTPEEIDLIVEESQQGGAIRGEAGRLLRELFDFGDLTAEQVMVPRVRVVGLRLGATPADVRALLLVHHHSRYPVFDGDLDHIVGAVHVKDLLRRLVEPAPVTRAGLRPLPLVPATARLDDVLAVMQRGRAHMAVVIDEHGGTAGVVSFEDLSDEVVGDMDDETSEQPRFVDDGPDRLRVAGTVRLDELSQRIGRNVEHENVESVSGLILTELGRPPLKGDVVEFAQVRFEVTAVSGRGVREARVTW